MKSKSLQAAKTGKAKGPSAKPFFIKRGSKEADGAFFRVPNQPGLRVGKPDSQYEKEADNMADIVTATQSNTSNATAQTAPSLYNKVTPLVQRQAVEEEETGMQAKMEEEEVQTKSVAQRQEEEEETLQAQEEQEEELQTKIQRQEEEEEMLQAQEEEEEEMVQAQVEEEEEMPMQAQAQEEEEETLQAQEEEEEEMVQLRPSSPSKSLSNLSSKLKATTGQGQAMKGPIRSRMEKGFGADFSDVRIHTGTAAENMSESINAQAFTVGKDVFFNKDKFKPDTPEGDHLLAHELTHTIQQGAVKPLAENKATQNGSAVDASSASTADIPAVEESPIPEAPEAAEALTEEQAILPIGEEGLAVEEAEEVPDYPRTPEDNPAFEQAKQSLNQTSKKEQSHEPAANAASSAQAAAPSPGNERLSQAQAGQVEEMNQGAENKGEFDAEVFKSLLLEQIARILPTNEDEADDFADHNEMGSVKNAASNQAAAEKEKAAGSIQSTTEQEPDENAIPEREITPLEPQDVGTQPGGIGAANAMPPARSEAEVSQPLQQNMQEVNDVFGEEEVSDETLANSNEPEFLAARDATHEAQEHTNTAPSTFRQQESENLNNAQASAENDSALTLEGMHGNREDLLTQVEEQQEGTKEADSAERTLVANEINAIFERTKTDVETILESLDTEVASSFDAGAESARVEFEGFVARKMRKYMDDRYGGITGFARRVGDVFTGLPDEVNAFFVEGREQYIDTMDVVLTGIAENVANKLNEAQLRIETGRQEVADYVAGLPEDLQSIGQEQAEQIQSKFDELESDVKNKQNQLVNDLANRYKESLEAVDARIEEMKEANKGLIDRAIDFAKKVIAVIREIKNTIMGLISGAIDTIKAIISDPIGFLSNLISGITQGIQNFLGNIWNNLLEGFLAWLTGALGPVGITVPENLFSFEGVLDLIRQVLGLTYSFIREQAVKVFGEQVVSAIETTFEILVIFLRDGFMGVVEYIKDKLSELKAMVIDTIMNMVITEVIEAGIKWVLGLLSPASAFVKAALTIIDIVKFFIQKGRQIFALVEAVVNGIREIAAGNVAKVAQFVEDALKRAVPVIIGFLASLLGIGGLVEKVQGLIQTVRKKIADALISVFEGIKSLAMKLFNKLTGKKEEDEEPEDPEKAGTDEELTDSEVGETIPFSAEGESHKLWINTAGQGVEVMVSSTPMSVGDKLNDWEGRVGTLDEEKRGEASSLLSQAQSQYQATLQSGNVAEQEMEQAFSSDDVAEIQEAETADEKVEADEQTLMGTMKRLFEVFGEEEEVEITEEVQMNGQTHKLTIQIEERNVYLRSNGGPLETQLTSALTVLKEYEGATLAQGAIAEIRKMQSLLSQVFSALQAGTEVDRSKLREFSRATKFLLENYGGEFKVTDIIDGLPLYGPVLVGPHPVGNVTQPDGSTRESHHVPSKELAQSLGREMNNTAQILSTKNTPAARAAATDLRTKAAEISANSNGNELAAISLHRVTHQNAGGVAVHSAAMKDEIEAAIAKIDAKTQAETIRIVNIAGQDLAVNPAGKTLDQFINDVREKIAEEEIDVENRQQAESIIEELKEGQSELENEAAEEGLLEEQKSLKKLSKRAFDSSFAQGKAAVDSALEHSILDGPASERKAEARKLGTEAERTWKNKGLID